MPSDEAVEEGPAAAPGASSAPPPPGAAAAAAAAGLTPTNGGARGVMTNGKQEGDEEGGGSEAPYDESNTVLPPTEFLPPLPRRPRLDSRDSRRSFVLYGPVVSSRLGRPDHLASVIDQLNSPRLPVQEGDDVEAPQPFDEARAQTTTTTATPDAAKMVPEDEAVLPVSPTGGQQPLQLVIPTSAAQQPSDAKESPLVKKQRLYQRISVVVGPQDPTKLVQVNVRNVSYAVPVQLDKHTKTTVVNQSVCYFAYEFFRRLASLCTSRNPAASARYQVQDFASLFVPFESRPVLSNISLVLRPGQTYVVLGPPGCGKTTLLKAISGRLAHSKSAVSGQPVRGRPYLEGTIEYNGVSVEVRRTTIGGCEGAASVLRFVLIPHSLRYSI
jgi:ABC-type glutathione transport system ATPase component